MTTVAAPSQRTREAWGELARQILPELQAQGGLTPELRDKYGITYLYRLRVELAKLGYDIHGKPIEIPPIEAKRPTAVAKQIAKRRAKGDPSWALEAASGMNYQTMMRLLRENGLVENRDGNS